MRLVDSAEASGPPRCGVCPGRKGVGTPTTSLCPGCPEYGKGPHIRRTTAPKVLPPVTDDATALVNRVLFGVLMQTKGAPADRMPELLAMRDRIADHARTLTDEQWAEVLPRARRALTEIVQRT